MARQSSATVNRPTEPEVAHAQAAPAASAKKEESLPLPGWLTKIYYVFPIVLYIPDVIFNFFVYSDGAGVNVNDFSFTQVPAMVLFAFLSVGIVGMAWLLSVLAPWHWARHNYFQSIMCWFGVIIATSITIWNSLAYRSEGFRTFETDKWFSEAFHISTVGFSPTMVLVAVAPPFWGLFWAIVQPAVGKRTAAEEAESHVLRMERLKQEAEVKRLKAETNAQIREAQIKGLAATVNAARAQISGPDETPMIEGSVTITPDQGPRTGDRLVALPSGNIRRLSDRRSGGEETTDSGEHEIVRGAANMSYSVAAQPRDDVFEAPEDGAAHPTQGRLAMDGRGPITGENETLMSTSRPGMPRASTLLRNYADGEHVMRTVDSDVDQMRGQGMKITIKTFAEYRGIDLSMSKQLLAKWREWKQNQAQTRDAAE